MFVESGIRVVAIAFALVVLTAALGNGVGAAPGLAQSGAQSSLQAQSYEGVVTDTHCGAKHAAAIGDTAVDCTIRCVRAGERFLLVDGESSYLLEGDPLVLKRAAGQRVKIVGTLNAGKISVTSIVVP